MKAPTFTPANPVTHHDALIAINIEYLSWLAAEGEAYLGIKAEDSLGMSITEYIPTVLDKICGDPPPRGIFYLVELEQKIVGMGGIRWLSPGIAEVKRLYICPANRGAGLGVALLERLLTDARTFGYQRVRLDTAPFMSAAHRLYEAAGFVDCASYEESEVPVAFHPVWRFMEKSL